MPNFVNKAIARLYHHFPIKPQNSPHPYNAPIYGQIRQFDITTITNEKLTPDKLKHCQKSCVLSNYHAQAIENNMQTAISAIASSPSTSSWKDIKFIINQFLEYAATHPNAKIRYYSSQIHLWIHSDASYLNAKARSLTGGLFYLSENPKLPIKTNYAPPKPMHRFLSTEKSSTLSCPLFKNMKLAQVSSPEKMMCPFTIA